ncbi:MAG: 50S ribosomal protein L11 methyltransferase [Pseudomonadota bacterium]
MIDAATEALAGPQPLAALAELLVASSKSVPLPDLAASALALRKSAPTDRTVWSITDILLYSQVPDYHWQMVADAPRNQAYATAIQALVRPGMIVLEIGAGSGLLAMLAARAGADHVFTVEANPLMAEVARECIDRNGFSDRVTVISGHSTALTIGKEIPRKADALIHEIFSSDMLGENVLPSVAHAKAQLLSPDALLLPNEIAAIGALARPPQLRLTDAMSVEGLDLSSLAAIDAAVQKYGPGRCQRLSDPTTLLNIDLTRFYPEQDRGYFALEATGSGVASGIEQWMHIAFPDGTALVTDDAASHWQACFHPFGTGVEVREGTLVELAAEFAPGRLTIGLARHGEN